MAYSITITVSADGTVAISSTERAGGVSTHVGSRHGGDVADLGSREYARKIASDTTLKIRDDEGWNTLDPHLREAVREIGLCLPAAEDFDESGRPCTAAAALPSTSTA